MNKISFRKVNIVKLLNPVRSYPNREGNSTKYLISVVRYIQQPKVILHYMGVNFQAYKRGGVSSLFSIN